MKVFYYAPDNLIINLEEVVTINGCSDYICFTLKNQESRTFITDLTQSQIEQIMKDIYTIMAEGK